MNKTQANLIEAAEREFAERGFHGASIRDITNRAKANVAAVNYHFGSKEELFIEMIRRRVEPINAYRLKTLKAALEKNDGAPLPIYELIDLLVRPLVEAYLEGNKTGNHHYFMRAMGRGMAEESQFMAVLRKDVFSEILKTFKHELSRTVSDVPAERIQICFDYLGSTLSGVLQYNPRKTSEEAARTAPDASQLVCYLVGGIQALLEQCRAASK